MIISATIMNCGITWRGREPVAKTPAPYPRLRSVFNRGWWLGWGVVEQADGSLDWSLADAWVAGCEAQGVQPLAVLGDYPQRAIGKAGPNIAEAAQFAALASKRYAGRVRHWQTGNEVDTAGPLFDNYSGELAGRMHRAVESAILGVDPGAVVIAPSVQSIWLTGHGLQTLRGIVQGYGGLPRHVAVHVYTEGERAPGDVTAALHRVWGALEAFGKTGDVPVRLWGTEVGVTGFSAMPGREQNAWLRSVICACRAGGMHSFHFYNLDHGAGAKDYGFPQPSAARWNEIVRAVA